VVSAPRSGFDSLPESCPNLCIKFQFHASILLRHSERVLVDLEATTALGHSVFLFPESVVSPERTLRIWLASIGERPNPARIRPSARYA